MKTSGVPVLVLRALGLGDALVAVPALRGLRRRFPGRPLVLAASGPPAALLREAGVVDAVLPTAGLGDAPPGPRLGAALGRPVTGHLAVNLHGRGPASHRLLLAGHPTGLLGFANREAGWPHGPGWRPGEHEAVRWCRLVGWAGGRCDPTDLRLPTGWLPAPPPGTPGCVVVHPGTTGVARRWPADRWAAVAGRLAARGHRVVVTAGPAERRLAAGVAAAAGLPPATAVAGDLALADLCALVAAAALVCSADTGVAHLAGAFGTPSVRVFGPVPPSRWGPLADTDRHAVLWHGAGGGDPCADRPDPAVLRVGEAEVLAAADALLATVPSA